MKPVLALTVPVEVHITADMIRAAAGPDLITYTRRMLAQERAKTISDDLRRSPVAALGFSVTKVVSALARYENNVGSRDEKKALAALIAACCGLRTASKAVRFDLEEKENRA